MNEIFIERRKDILRIAIKENSKLKECLIEEESDDVYAGQIYKGLIQNIIPAIKCAFVDIGRKKNAYIYIDAKFRNIDMKKGDEVIVQVIKEEIGNKGPKVTNALSIPGRYCVLQTMSKELVFSKKIEDPDFKAEISRKIVKPKDIGIMIRTNATHVGAEVLNEEIERLDSRYRELKRKAEFAVKPGIVFDDGGILGRVLRDKASFKTSKIYVDDNRDYEYIEEFLAENTDVAAQQVLHEDERTLLDYYGIEKEIMRLRRDKIYLVCGGHINIDKTEAMYVIDVNSGKNIKGSSIEKTVYQTNIQAAEEIARQIKLRNLSGIIVVDFIDMDNESWKEEVLSVLRKGFEDDKSKTTIYGFTELNLVQIARRRTGKPINEYIEEDCSECAGKGKRLKFSYLCLLIRNEIIRLGSAREINHIQITVNEMYEKDIRDDILGFVRSVNAMNKTVYLSIYKGEAFKLEPVIFESQIQNLECLRIYG
ncbi:MAG: Rne/Rng family ribonuclease [Clostridiaceae bacterium]